jgi:hypothetical protein
MKIVPLFPENIEKQITDLKSMKEKSEITEVQKEILKNNFQTIIESSNISKEDL